MKKLIVPIAALGLMSGAAFAQDASNNFATLDADLNGELSFAEVVVGWPELTQAEFDTADVDMSGGLSVDELASIVGPTTLPAPADGAMMPADGAMMPVEPIESAPAPAPAEPPESLSDTSDD